MTDTVYKTESEIAPLLGLTEADWAATALVLERSGLPRQDPVFGDRRYWPAVKRFLDQRAGLFQNNLPLAPDGEENHEYEPAKRRSGA